MSNGYDSSEYGSGREAGLRTRDLKSMQGRGGYSTKVGSKMSRPTGESALSVFTRRTAQILDVAKSDVPDIMVAASQKAVRVNPLQFSGESAPEQHEIVESELSSHFEIEKLPWYDGAYLFEAFDTPAVQAHPLTQEGKTFIQNPSSFLPVIALDPARGQNILDMCSAPGGKTSLIAAMTMESKPAITANEAKGRRAQRMREVFGTLGVEGVVALDHDGRHLPAILGRSKFDRILVDAECSTDAGINFGSSNPLKDWTLDRVQRMHILQKQLITSAYDMLQPGGVLVYSTCTLSPEENEGVVTSLIERRKDAIIQPLEFSAEETVRKIKKWNGTQYPDAVAKGIVRIFPGEHMESFCLTRIRKPSGDENVDVKFKHPVILEELIFQGTKNE
jgi:16S rRNA (cytosine1407-C5)-methyltransferase